MRARSAAAASSKAAEGAGIRVGAAVVIRKKLRCEPADRVVLD